MKESGYGNGYKYAHDYPGNFVKQQFLPDNIKDFSFWKPQHNASEERMRERMEQLWGDKFTKK